VLVGINLLREGLDLPEVSLVAILDADKEGFLRNERSLTQTSGRAARNANGLVIMYADRITKSMQATIDETNRRRAKQIAFNEANGITPQTVLKSREQILEQTAVVDIKGNKTNAVYIEPDETSTALAADPIIQYMTRPQLEKSIEKTRRDMLKAAKEQDFMAAARLRDELFALQNEFKKLYEHT
jgi:excinuclease ABC subunit B